jgi:ADP-ribose pyrophosphatase
MKHLTWKRKSERWEQTDPYFKRLVREYDLPNGKNKTAYLTDPGQFVVGLAVTKDLQHTILVKEFRPGPEKIIIDLPCGSMYDHEDPCEAMAREFREETGYTGNVELVNICHSSPYSTQRRYTCLIRDCEPYEHGQNLDPDEFIEPVKMSLREFIDDYLVKGNTINSAAAFFALSKLGLLTV